MAQTIFDLWDPKTQQPSKVFHPQRMVAEIEEALPDLRGIVHFNTAYTKIFTDIQLDPETEKAVWKLIKAHDPKGKLPAHERQRLEDVEALRVVSEGADAAALAELAEGDLEKMEPEDCQKALVALIRQNRGLVALARKALQS